MEAIAAHMNSRCQTVIPRAVHQILGLQADDTLLFIVSGDTVILRKRPSSFTEAMRGLHKELWPSDPDAWLEQERGSWE